MLRSAIKTTTGRLLVRQKHTLPELKYGYDALEPAISEQIMRLHHTKHHQTYVTNLNAAEGKLAECVASGDVKGSIATQAAIKFNGGGHLNHSLFWENLAPSPAPPLDPSSKLGKAVEGTYGSVDGLIAKFNTALASIQGSGWGWLVRDAETGGLKITTTANQDPITKDTVLIGIDAWEHAYYLQYENAKVKYFENIWKVIDWKTANQRFEKAS